MFVSKYVALVRGIGPGDPRKTNEKLRGVLEGLGFTGVQSVISSGNIIFESPEADVSKLERTVEAAWPKMLGFEATTIIRSLAQLQKILSTSFFDSMTHSEGSYLLLTFFKKPTKVEFQLPYQVPEKPYKIMGFSDNVLFTVTDNSINKTTDLMSWLEKQFGKEITSRTPLTIQRIVKKMESK